MDEYDVIIEDTAKTDLRGILRYIKETLKEPVAAQRKYSSIKEQIIGLNQMPLRFPLIRDENLAARGLRWMPASNYTVFYTVEDTLNEVHILRVLYKHRE